MRHLLILLLALTTLFSARIAEVKWASGEVFSVYLERNGIPVSLLKTIPASDLQYLSEIQAGMTFYELHDKGALRQALIPIGEEMQIHISHNLKTNRFQFDITPIIYKSISDDVTFSVNSSLYGDLNKQTNNPRLGYLLKSHYRGSLGFRKLRKGDTVTFSYRQKSRLGKPWGTPEIDAAVIHTIGKDRLIYRDDEGGVVTGMGSSIAYANANHTKHSKTFVMPLKRIRVTSRFTYKRWHPVLKRYRPHLGIDLGGKRGTKIYATHAGKVTYAGWMGGYGKVVKIKHSGGYVSLYAHQSKIRVKRGQYVKRAQVIGAVGSTGRSTGPHLHFGLYHNNKAVNPFKYMRKKGLMVDSSIARKIKEQKRVAIKQAKRHKKRLLVVRKKQADIFRWEKIKSLTNTASDQKKYQESDRISSENMTKG